MSLVTVKPKDIAGARRMNLEKIGATRWPGTKDNIRVAGDRVSGFKIPMNDLVVNPWFESKEATPNEKEKITKREYFERRVGGGANFSINSPFWEDYKVTMVDGVNYFNTEDPWKELQLEILKASARVANSPNELSKWPDAKYVIYDETEEAEKKAKKAEVQMDALDALREMTPEYKKNLCRVIGKDVTNFTDSSITSVLFEFITTTPKGGDRFLEYIKVPKERIAVESLIREALKVDALRTVGGQIVRVVDNQDGSPIGVDMQKAVDFLSLKKNVMIREAIESEIKVKRSTRVGIN